tara:strand:- start:148 stop:276 length:129 start_codon:yes stop_codon:yes gene_type:complete
MKQLEGLKADDMAGFVKEDSVYLFIYYLFIKKSKFAGLTNSH